MAALLANRTKRCWIRVADADEQERSDLEASENLHRRQDNRDELIARRVHRIVEKIAATKGRIASRRGVAVARRDVASARKRVAAQLGTTSKAIKSAEERAGRAKGGIGDVKAVRRQGGIGGQALYVETGAVDTEAATDLRPAPDRRAELETFGVEVTHEFCDEVAITRGALRKADLLLQQAQAALKVLTTQNFPGAVYQDLKAAIHAAGANVRLAVPAVACVYCRDALGTQGRRANCNGCGKHGYLLLSQRDAVPKELLAKGAKPVTGVSRSAAKRVSIDEDGQPIEVEPFDEPAEDTA
jgi:hypothetical protein